MRNTIFITWQYHLRTTSIAEALDIKLYEILSTGRFGIRYVLCIFSTLKILAKEKPTNLIVQNPSLVLTLLTCLLKPIFRYKLIVDAHNEAIQPFIYDNALFQFLAKVNIKSADLTIVTNLSLKNKVHAIGGTGYVLPDPLPNITVNSEISIPLKSNKSAVLISTYAEDEPYNLVIDAFSKIPQCDLYITGRSKNAKLLKPLPPNVTLTDFLPKNTYYQLLKDCDIVLDLTEMEDCLVCGAYEAIALEKPLILTENSASVELFGSYAIHVQHNLDSIASAVEDLLYSTGIRKNDTRLEKKKFLELESLRIKDFKAIFKNA